MLSPAGFAPVLAYVRHAREFDPRREKLAEHDAEQRLERGAALLGDPKCKREVLLAASTGEGLARLAERAGASLVVFGSDYRTTPGHLQPGTSAQHLLDGGAVSVAVAVAGLRTRLNDPIKLIAVPVAGPRNEEARQTAGALAERLDARLEDSPAESVDLIVVGSQPEAPAGRVVVGGDVRAELDRARSSVLVVPAGAPLLP
jgi:nucleotide-binding universal stress UspA family protein